MDRAKVMPMLKGILVLAVIALCSGLLLGAFNILTYVDPLQSTYEQFAADTGATFSEMKDTEGKEYGDGSVVYYAVSDDGQYHAFLVSGSGGFGGDVQMYIYIRNSAIEKIVIGENGETYLGRLEEANFYDNFIGKDVSELDVMSVDVVSGASRSSAAVKNGVNAAVSYYNENVAGGENNG